MPDALRLRLAELEARIDQLLGERDRARRFARLWKEAAYNALGSAQRMSALCQRQLDFAQEQLSSYRAMLLQTSAQASDAERLASHYREALTVLAAPGDLSPLLCQRLAQCALEGASHEPS